MKKYLLSTIIICGLCTHLSPIDVIIKHFSQTEKNKTTSLCFYRKIIDSTAMPSRDKKELLQQINQDTEKFFTGIFPKNGKQFAAFDTQTNDLLGLLSINQVKKNNQPVILIGGPVVLDKHWKKGIGKKLLTYAIRECFKGYTFNDFYTQAVPCLYCMSSGLFCNLFGICSQCAYSWFIKQGFTSNGIAIDDTTGLPTPFSVLKLDKSKARCVFLNKKNN